MASDVERFIIASDNASDYADHLIEGLEQAANEDIDDLYRRVEPRDLEFWETVEVNTEAVISDFDAVPRNERDLDWTLGLSGMSAAALYQFFLDNREDTIIKPTAYREQLLSGFNLSRAELVQAGKRGFEVAGEATFKRLQASFVNELAFMRNMSDAELYQFLVENGAMRPIDDAIASAQGYVSRMTTHAPGSPQFKEEVANLISRDSSRALKGMNRRAVENIYTARQVGGDVDRLMVWIVEGGKNICDYCAQRAGVVLTYLEWVEQGLPGSDVCRGGDACRCGLAAV